MFTLSEKVIFFSSSSAYVEIRMYGCDLLRDIFFYLLKVRLLLCLSSFVSVRQSVSLPVAPAECLSDYIFSQPVHSCCDILRTLCIRTSAPSIDLFYVVNYLFVLLSIHPTNCRRPLTDNDRIYFISVLFSTVYNLDNNSQCRLIKDALCRI